MAQKSEDAAWEVDAAAQAIQILGGRQPVIHPVELPGMAASHLLIVIKKASSTPERYPRRTGIPSKRPL